MHTNNIIYLEPLYYELEEVIIYDNSALAIVKRAIKNISVNFQSSEFVLYGFQREHITMNGDKELYTINSYLSASYPSYANRNYPKITIQKMEKKKFIETDTLLIRLKDSGNLIADNDLVKTKNSFLNLKNLEDYDFKFKIDSSMENSNIYSIHFEPHKRKSFIKGDIFIDKKTFAIIGFVTDLTDDGIRHSTNFAFKFISSHCEIFYKKIGSKWYLRNIKFNLIIRPKLYNNFGKNLLYSRLDFVTSSIDTVNKFESKNFKNFLNENEIMLDKKMPYDSLFWQNSKPFLKAQESNEFLDSLNSTSEIVNGKKRFNSKTALTSSLLYLNSHLRTGFLISNFNIKFNSNLWSTVFALPDEKFYFEKSHNIRKTSSFGLGFYSTFSIWKGTNVNFYTISNFGFFGPKLIGSLFSFDKNFTIWRNGGSIIITPGIGYQLTNAINKWKNIDISDSEMYKIKFNTNKITVSEIESYKTKFLGLDIAFNVKGLSKINFGVQYYFGSTINSSYQLKEQKISLNNYTKNFDTNNSAPISKRTWGVNFKYSLK